MYIIKVLSVCSLLFDREKVIPNPEKVYHLKAFLKRFFDFSEGE